MKTTCPAKMKVVASTAAMVPGGIDFCRQESKVGGEGNTHTAVGERKWLWAHAPPRSPEVAACPIRAAPLPRGCSVPFPHTKQLPPPGIHSWSKPWLAPGLTWGSLRSPERLEPARGSVTAGKKMASMAPKLYLGEL